MEKLLSQISGYVCVFQYQYLPNHYLFFLPNNAHLILNEREMEDIILDFEGNLMTYYDFYSEMHTNLN